MVWLPHRLAALLFTVAGLFAGSLCAADGLRVDAPQAAQIAVNDYSERLAKERELDPSDLSRYVTDIHNYDIGMRETGDAYIVRFTLKQPKGRSINGGGGEYKIKKGSLEIVSFTGYE